MKKGIILLGILSLFSLQANEIKKIGDRSLVETVSEELVINKKNIIIEDVLQINMNSGRTVKLELLIQTNNLNIDFLDMNQIKIVKK